MFAGRVRHIEAAAPIADRHTIVEDVFAESNARLGIERIHKAIPENISDNDIGMTWTIDEITICMNARPVKRHEACFIVEDFKVVFEILLEIFTLQIAWSRDNI